MKREEIEQLLAEYTNGEISSANRQYLEKLFEQDAKLKREADNMAAVWQSLKDLEEGEQPDAEMDKQFYAMLKNVKTDKPKGARIIQISAARIKTAAAIAACLAMFVIGRYTVAPVQVVKYTTVYVKQPVNIPTEIPKTTSIKPAATLAQQTIRKDQTSGANTALAQQLRSVYVSDRIAAVMQITMQKNINSTDLMRLEIALKEDPNPNVRLTVIRSLRPFVNKQNVQQVLISGLNHQDDLLVQSSLVDLLVEAKSKQAIPQMITLMDNKNTDAMVQDKIKDGIEAFLN